MFFFVKGRGPRPDVPILIHAWILFKVIIAAESVLMFSGPSLLQKEVIHL